MAQLRRLVNDTSGEFCDKEETETAKKCEKRSRSDTVMVYVVFVSLLFDLLAFTIILPLLPSLMEYYRLNDSSGLYAALSERIRCFQDMVGAPERFSSVLFGGFLGSMFSFLQFVTSPIVGGLSDYYGRKPMLLICALGIAFSYLLWALSHNFILFVIARFVGGLSKGNISLSMSVITDVSTEATRGSGMALVGIAFSLGFIIGPMIGALFAIFANKTSASWYVVPAVLALVLSLMDLIVLTFLLKETLPKEKRVKRVSSALTYAMQFLNVSSIFKFSAIKDIEETDKRSLQRIGLVYFLYLFLYSALEFTVTFLMYHKFGYTAMDQAKMFLTIGIIMTVLQGTVVRRVPRRLVPHFARLSLLLIVPAFICVGLAEGSKMLYFGMVLYAISTAFTVTCLTTWVSIYGNDDQKGSVLGIFRSLGALARALGPIVGSISFWCIGSARTYIIGGLLLLYPTWLLS